VRLIIGLRTGRDPLLDTAMALHDAALKDEYFVSRKLAPNVDFWRSILVVPISSSSLTDLIYQWADLPCNG